MANFITGNTGTFSLLQGGSRTEFEQDSAFYNTLSQDGRVMMDQAQSTLDSYQQVYRQAEEIVKALEVDGMFLNKHSIYDVSSIERLGNPNYAMSHFVASHPYYAEMNQAYGYTYPLVEPGSEGMLEVLNNVARSGVIRYDEDTNEEYYTLTSDDVRDVGMKKLKWREKLDIATTYEFLDLCREHGIDIFEHQLKDYNNE